MIDVIHLTKALLLAIPLLAPAVPVGPFEEVAIEADPVVETNARSCANYPYDVYCYANHRLPPGTNYFNCYSTLCDAVADGSYQCHRNLRGTCK